MKLLRTLPILLLIVISSCSKNGNTALIDQANKAYAAKNTADAAKLYEQFLREIPESPHAPKALYNLGSIYQTDAKNAPRALEMYDRIATAFPKDSLAPKSLFVCGFLCANVLNDTAKARRYYEKYLVEFAAADSNITKSVRLELQHLGKTPEQVLEELQKTSNATSANGHQD